eukprot:5894207-Prymnesium_polylepis.1
MTSMRSAVAAGRDGRGVCVACGCGCGGVVRVCVVCACACECGGCAAEVAACGGMLTSTGGHNGAQRLRGDAGWCERRTGSVRGSGRWCLPTGEPSS